MKADMVKKLAIMLMSQNKEMNMNDALSVVFNSDTYQKIMDEKAGLYYQSARYPKIRKQSQWQSQWQ